MNKVIEEWNEVIEAWKTAAQDLDLEVDSNFVTQSNISAIHIKYFGSINGIVISDMNKESSSQFSSGDVYSSQINPIVYSKYDRGRFIDALEDWGWFGPIEKRPGWYSGKYYKGDSH